MAEQKAYAAGTKVSIEGTQNHIRALVKRFGATDLGIAERGNGAIIAFRIQITETEFRDFRIYIVFPEKEDFLWISSKDVAKFRRRTREQIDEAWEQGCRAKWRALFRIVEAKFIAVSEGVETIEEAFFKDIVMSDGRTMYEWAQPEVRAMYQNGRMPEIAPGFEHLRAIEARKG
jgi:hypothetical protein